MRNDELSMLCNRWSNVRLRAIRARGGIGHAFASRDDNALHEACERYRRMAAECDGALDMLRGALHRRPYPMHREANEYIKSVYDKKRKRDAGVLVDVI